MTLTRITRPLVRAGLPLVAALSAACGGGGGSGGGGSVAAPANLAYATPRATYLVGVEIADNEATFTGTVTSFSVSPPLPAGLRIDPLSGDLEGTPSATSTRTTHSIVASNSGGSARFDLELAVELPARFLLSAGGADSTLASYRVDVADGSLSPHSYAAAGDDQIGPEALAVHPEGSFAFVPNATTDNISVYAIDATTGFLSPGTPAVVGAGPHELVLRPDGAFAYVASEAASKLLVFSVDQTTGALTQVAAPVDTRPLPISLAIDPTGRWLLVGNAGAPRSLQLFEIDAVSGALSAPASSLGLNGGLPVSIDFEPSGRHAFAALENYDAVISLTVDPLGAGLTLVSPSGTGDQPGGVAVHPLGDFTYVTNRATGSVSSFRVDPADGSLTPLATVPAGTNPSGALFDPTGSTMYVLDRGAREILAFAVDAGTGTLTAAGRVRSRQAPVAFALVPGAGPVRPVTTHAYVTNGDSDDVSTFRIDPLSGSLTEVGLAALTGDAPADVALDPLRRYAWVADRADDTLRTYAIDQVTGALFENAPALAVGDEPVALSVDPSGRFLFAALRGANAVGAFRIDPADGSLLQTAGLPLPNLLTATADVAIDPTGQFLFAAAEGDGNPSTSGVAVWTIDAHTGVPVALVQPALLQGASRLCVHPSGRQLYALERQMDTLSVFSIASATGSLALMPSAALTGELPSALAVDDSGRDAYVVLAESAGPGTIALHPLDAQSGALSPATETAFAGAAPADAALDAAGRWLYVLNGGSNSIGAFRRDASTGELAPPSGTLTGLGPTAIALATTWQ
jgi:6-phosphogluconolactonase (cycloisomerase 2 family)